MQDLLNIVALLRDKDDGCPWDIKQTHESIKANLLEEAYEATDAINLRNNNHLCEELGDILLQVALHSQIAVEGGEFKFDDVCDGVCKKLIYRHPHIFGDTIAKTDTEVLHNWEMLKREEKSREALSDDIADVPKNFPALMYTQKIQKRADNHGFSYQNVQIALSDLKSEVAELEQAFINDNKNNISEELGDILFCATNLARIVKLDAEQILSESTQKFVNRILTFHALAKPLGGIEELSKAQSDELWEEVKMGFTAT